MSPRLLFLKSFCTVGQLSLSRPANSSVQRRFLSLLQTKFGSLLLSFRSIPRNFRRLWHFVDRNFKIPQDISQKWDGSLHHISMSQKTNVTNQGWKPDLITCHSDKTAFISFLILKTSIPDPHPNSCLWENP